MYVFSQTQVVRTGREFLTIYGWGLLVVSALLAVALMLGGCCSSQYLNDGSTGPGARPYYKLERCWLGKPRVVCDSPERLPSNGCK